jgi:hypothetical protein
MAIRRTAADETHAENQRKLEQVMQENGLATTRGQRMQEGGTGRIAAYREELRRRPHFRIKDHEPKGYNVGD